ncbi:hypothetical protein MLD38_035276 [Melastoma candidum]|uniref:Uncharacterized protein n=1 Tax=Melastoma candidum TaxID=119954 RepID=A0ACB9ME67_9MYRT|nr:hypothetical protein MLD38_035276 [Melastoma candidum]
MADIHNLHGNSFHGSSGLHIALRNNSDYEESEVWDVLGDTGLSPAFYSEDEPRVLMRKNRATAIRGIPRPQPSSGASRVQRSAPVDIPSWGKDSRGGSSSSGKKKEARDNSDDDDEKERESDEEEEEEDFGEEGGYGDCELPPHEFIAKRLARSHIWSFSVFEGAGRKLKGRDLSAVRHAVLAKTGFLDPPSNLDSSN